MQIKTINQVIEKKIDEWVQSITDESLRDRLKKNNSLFTQALKGKLKTAKKHTWTYIQEK